MKTMFGAAAMTACVATLTIASAASADAFQNGSFENRNDGFGGGFGTLDAPSTAMTGWTVTSGSIDYIPGSFWQPSDGGYSLDMSGGGAGSIAQTFDTVAGRLYTVLFDLSKNPGSIVPTLQVGAAGVSQDFTFLAANSTSDMMWATQTFTFTAQGNSTTLTFASLDPSASGPALDNVRVSFEAVDGAVPEPATWGLMIAGFGLVGGAMRRRAGVPAVA